MCCLRVGAQQRQGAEQGASAVPEGWPHKVSPSQGVALAGLPYFKKPSVSILSVTCALEKMRQRAGVILWVLQVIPCGYSQPYKHIYKLTKIHYNKIPQ